MLRKLNSFFIAVVAISPLVLNTIQARAESSGAEGQSRKDSKESSGNSFSYIGPDGKPVLVETTGNIEIPIGASKPDAAKLPEAKPAPANANIVPPTTPAPPPSTPPADAKAAEAKPADKPADAKPVESKTAETRVPMDRANAQELLVPVKSGELGRFFKVAKFGIVGGTDGSAGKLGFTQGLIDKECAKQITIELNEPSEALATSDYTVTVKKKLIVDKNDPSKIMYSADDTCFTEKTNKCNDRTCISLKTSSFNDELGAVELDKSDCIKYGNYETASGNDSVSPVSLPGAAGMGDGKGCTLLTPGGSVAKRLADAKEKKAQEIRATCEDAKKGDREAISALEEQLISSLGSNKKTPAVKSLIDGLNANALENDRQELEDAIADTDGDQIKLTRLIDKVYKFYKDNKKTMKEESVKLELMIAQKANESEQGTDNDKLAHQMHLLAEKAIAKARVIDPTSSSLKKTWAIARIGRHKWEAATGDDFFADVASREFSQDVAKVNKWASNSKDSEWKKIAQDYNRTNMPRDITVPGMMPNGRLGPMGLTSGNGLSEVYYKAAGQKLHDEYLSYAGGQSSAGYNLGGSNGPNSLF